MIVSTCYLETANNFEAGMSLVLVVAVLAHAVVHGANLTYKHQCSFNK